MTRANTTTPSKRKGFKIIEIRVAMSLLMTLVMATVSSLTSSMRGNRSLCLDSKFNTLVTNVAVKNSPRQIIPSILHNAMLRLYNIWSIPMKKTLILSAILLFSPLAHSAPSNLRFESKVVHLFDRLTFGARPGDVEKIKSLGEKGIQSWLNTQLNPELIDDSNVEHKLSSIKSYGMTPAQLLLTFKKPEDVAAAMGIKADDFKRNDELKKEVRKKIGEDLLPEAIVRGLSDQRLIRGVESRRQLQEVLVDFWLNHFNVLFRSDSVVLSPQGKCRVAVRLGGNFLNDDELI